MTFSIYNITFAEMMVRKFVSDIIPKKTRRE